MSEELNAYETIIILRPEFAEEKKYTKKINEYVHKIIHGDSESDSDSTTIPAAYVHKIDRIGKKKLAYETRGFTEGVYVLFKYRAPSERIAQLDLVMRRDDDVIKFMTLRLDAEEAEVLAQEAVISEQPEDINAVEKEIDAFDLIFGKI